MSLLYLLYPVLSASDTAYTMSQQSGKKCMRYKVKGIASTVTDGDEGEGEEDEGEWDQEDDEEEDGEGK